MHPLAPTSHSYPRMHTKTHTHTKRHTHMHTPNMHTHLVYGTVGLQCNLDVLNGCLAEVAYCAV
jgi:hypothetical protein